MENAIKIIQSIKRRRKHRHAKLRDMAREDEEGLPGRESRSFRGEEIVCPICLMMVRGDQDILDAHVDACLADERRRLDEQQTLQELQRADEQEVWDETYSEGAAGHVGNVRGIPPIQLFSQAVLMLLQERGFTREAMTSRMWMKK